MQYACAAEAKEKFMRVFFFILGCLSLSAASVLSASAAEPCDSNRSQAELNNCYGAAYKKSDAILNDLYQQLLVRLKNDQVTTKLLGSAQKAWLTFRDAECAFSSSGVSGGTIYPMIHAICLDSLTTKRIADFKTYLKCEEGDLSCPVPAAN
jgi:uncharacterized protein YecT (DUF1311 family)